MFIICQKISLTEIYKGRTTVNKVHFSFVFIEIPTRQVIPSVYTDNSECYTRRD